ncbi:MAG: HAD family hydrolase [Candidatus Andersenbacteria bacterium]|nr:HAD family hydrolase [Candidatus Andersenbacteria bacterium]
MSKKVAFLDRDGTINVDHGYVNKVEDWEFVPGATQGMKLLQEAGFTLAVVTNQSGIAQGLYTEADMDKLHGHMKRLLSEDGVEIAHVASCPHARDQDDCDCRKPKAGMAKQIEAAIGPIDYAASWIIGDKEADVGFGKNAGTHTALLESDYWQADTLKDKPDLIAPSLFDAAQMIISANGL